MISANGRREWLSHWLVVVASMLGIAVATIHMYSLGIMIVPLEEEFGWSRAEITSGLFIISLVVFPLSPVMGMAIDRYGSRRIALGGIVAYALAIALLSMAQKPIWTWWLFWLFLAFAHLSLKPTVWFAALSTLFKSSRGLAFGVAQSATGLTSLGAPLLTYFMVQNFGWRMAYMMWGAVALAALPVIWLCFYGANDYRYRGGGGEPPAKVAVVGSKTSVLACFRSHIFVKLATVAFIATIVTMGLFINLVPILVSLHMGMATAAAMVGIVGFTQIVGRVTGGLLLDRFNARIIGTIFLALPIVSCLLLLASGSTPATAIIAVLSLGLAIGAEMDVVSYFSARFYGIGNFGVMFGGVMGFVTLGLGLGPVLASAVYDNTGSYEIVLWAAIALSLLSAVLLLTIGSLPNIVETGSAKANKSTI